MAISDIAADVEKQVPIEKAESPASYHEDEYEQQSRQSSKGNIEEDRPPLGRSTTTSSRAVSVVRVPINSRTGLFSRLSLLYEAEEPKNYPRNVKWGITFVIALAAVAAPMGSAIILPALNEIAADFHTDAFIANLSIALYMLSMSIFPLWWSSFSETAGRRTIYIVSFSLFALWNILAAVSNSIGMFIVMRVLSGGAAASVQAVGAGTVADIWHVKERGTAMGIFYLGPLCGPLIAPVIGGGLTEGLGWRSTQWFQVIYGGIVLLLIIFCLPETHKKSVILEAAEEEAEVEIVEKTNPGKSPALSRTTSRHSVVIKKTVKYAAVLRRILIDPLRIIAYLRFPAVALTVYYASIAFGSLYFLNISVEKTFSAPPYSFHVVIVGCLYIFNSVGYLLSSIFGGRWVDRIMAREARKAGRIDDRGKLILRPEDRMRENMWIAATLMPIALIWYGWTADRGVYWLVPMIANFFFGIGSMLVFGSATTMLTEMMPQKSSNGVALNNFVRNIFSFAGTFLADPLINAIGNGWLFTILGIIAALSSVVILLMRRYGEQWSEDMRRRM